MDGAGLSTAIMLALAVVLWFLYFVPTWIRRREYLATERTATRLQRTIRIMAEAAEAPDEVHVEANLREAARAERLRVAQERQIARAALRDAEAAAAERARIEADRRRAAELRVATSPSAIAPASDRARLARLRRAAGIVLLAALIVAVVQLWLMASAGVAPGAWVVLAGCAAAAIASVTAQGRIRAQLIVRAPVAEVRTVPRRATAPTVAEVAPAREWMPRPLPRPRYLDHPDAAPVGPSLGAPTMDAATQLRMAAAAAALPDEKVTTLPAREERPAATVTPSAPSRYASMGMLDDLGAAPDLDDVLARRRKVG